MKCRLVIAILIMAMMTIGCTREVSSIRFYPQDNTVKETETKTQPQKEELYFKISYNNENFTDLNIISEIETGELKAENVTEFNLKIPENAGLNGFCMNGDELYYSYDFTSYEVEQFFSEHIQVEHTEDLYTRVMSYNYKTGETKCIYAIETPGINISGLRVQGNIAVWYEHYYDDMNVIYGNSDLSEELINGRSMTKIYNLETGTLMELEENSENGYLVDLTYHPFMIYSDYESKIYKYDFETQQNTTLIDNMENFRVFCTENVIAHIVDNLEYNDVALYDYNGAYLYTFRTNIQYIEYVLVNDEIMVFVCDDMDDSNVFLVYEQNTGEMHKVKYNPNMSNVVLDGSKIYSGDFGNSGIRVFDLESKTVSGDYYGDNAMELYYNSTGVAYACESQRGLYTTDEDGNKIIKFVVFNE